MGAMKGQTMQAADQSLGEGPTAPHPFAAAEFEQSPMNVIERDEQDTATPGASTED
jgi:hypothetical protein